MRYFNTTFINQTVNNPTNSYNLFMFVTPFSTMCLLGGWNNEYANADLLRGVLSWVYLLHHPLK